MNYKVQGIIRRNKKYLVLFLVLWFVLTVVLVMPLAYSIKNSIVNEKFIINKFFENIYQSVINLGSVIGSTFTPKYIGTFFNVLWKFSLVYTICMLIGLIKTAPKNE